VRNGHLLGRLLQGQVVGKEEGSSPQAVPAMGPGEGQKRDMLRHLLIRDAVRRVDDPLRPDQR
jgi:hypothetical protein